MHSASCNTWMLTFGAYVYIDIYMSASNNKGHSAPPDPHRKPMTFYCFWLKFERTADPYRFTGVRSTRGQPQ